ncbi:hypothetical protein FACS189418_1280 [Clostridia bacterium]|nr:hypothetical protein FACS189418_1280 [Clostridia bacterium]
MSIPHLIHAPNLNFFEDDIIGVVFPIYAFSPPQMVQDFLKKVNWKAEYSFAIATYGNSDQFTLQQFQKEMESNGKHFHYLKTLLMVENYLPSFAMEDEIKKIPKKHIEENLEKILDDIDQRVETAPKTISFADKIRSFFSKRKVTYRLNRGQAKSFQVNSQCVKCLICEKVCPTANIQVKEHVEFGNNCESCFACLHLCPHNAIHLKNEKSSKRWIHPEVKLGEIVAANNQIH